MAYAALYSGGKDSTLAIWLAENDGLKVSELITVKPEREDSYMFHKPNLHLIPKLAEALNIELIQIETKGEKEKEIEDIKPEIKGLDIDGLITGAVASNYQMDRIKDIAEEYSLEIYAPLWDVPQIDILNMLIDNDFRTVIVSVAAMGLDDSWLGREIDKKCVGDLKRLEDKYKINIAGEGGEYESLVIGGPNYRWNFEITDTVKKWDGKRGEIRVKDLKKV